jgi:hypothetical protein
MGQGFPHFRLKSSKPELSRIFEAGAEVFMEPNGANQCAQQNMTQPNLFLCRLALLEALRADAQVAGDLLNRLPAWSRSSTAFRLMASSHRLHVRRSWFSVFIDVVC